MTMLFKFLTAKQGYRDKWRTACRVALAHVPHIDATLNMIEGKQAADVSGLLESAGRIVMLPMARIANEPHRLLACLLQSSEKKRTPLGIEDHNLHETSIFREKVPLCCMLELQSLK